MNATIRKGALIVAFGCAATLAACQKPDRLVCTNRGLVTGTADFDECMSTLKQKREAIAAQQDRSERLIKAAASLAGRWGSGCTQNMAKMDCNSGE